MTEYKKKFYCGDKDEVPEGYERRGSRFSCLRKGVGVGMYLKEKELREKYDLPPLLDYEENNEEKESRFIREEKRGDIDMDKETYKHFIDVNFDKAKRNAIDIGDVFKQLAMLWKLERKIDEEK